MDKHTLIITSEQKLLIIKALEKFSQYTLGQTSLEQQDAKKLEQLLARHKNSIIVDAVNSSTR